MINTSCSFCAMGVGECVCGNAMKACDNTDKRKKPPIFDKKRIEKRMKINGNYPYCYTGEDSKPHFCDSCIRHFIIKEGV